MSTPPRAPPMHPDSFLRALRARPRLAGCGALALAIMAGGVMMGRPLPAMVLIGWNAGAVLYLVMAWRAMQKFSLETVRQRAVEQDEGRYAILLVVVLAAGAVLLAVGTQLAQVKEVHGTARSVHVGLAALTVLTSWLFTQVVFSLHYAHDFYIARVRGEEDPLLFPGTPDPGYVDFFHFACVIGTSAQTADISFNGSAMRPVGTVHCIVAFFFNASLLALSINLAAGLLL